MDLSGRAVWGVVLAASLMVCGLAAGTAIAGRWIVPAGSGLAGPAIALGYGLGGAAVGCLTAVWVSMRAGDRLLRAVTVPAALAALAIGAAVVSAVAGG